MKRNSLVHISVNFWRSGRTEKRLLKSICSPVKHSDVSVLLLRMLCLRNFPYTFGIHYFNKQKVVVIHYDLAHVQL